MLQGFNSEIKLFFVVAFIAVVVVAGGIWLFKGNPGVVPPPPQQLSFAPGQDITVQGMVFEVDRSQMQIDGPAVVAVRTEEYGEVRVLIEAEAGEVCKTSALPFPAEGDQIKVFGAAQNANTLRPCDSPSHYIKILTPSSTPNAVEGVYPEPVEGWQTYRNEEFGFEFQYPPDFVEFNNYYSRFFSAKSGERMFLFIGASTLLI